MLHEARFWESQGERIRCHLCPQNCSISPGRRGMCGVRENRDGKLYAMSYGRAASINIDPIEKKPLFHFYPGERVLSLGSVGCNLRCLHCQNYTISQASLAELTLREMRPEEVSDMAETSSCRGIAFTYNEPTIWHEFAYDAMKIAKERGLFTVYVTNGFIQEEPLRELSSVLDAMNIDIKGFSERFYDKICKAALEPVLEATKLAHELGIHIEITYLIIPGENDGEDEIRKFCRWMAELNPKVPVHFTRFHPDYEMQDRGPTPIATMEMARRVAEKEGLKFVFLGNVSLPHGEDTVCPNCGNLVIERQGFHILRNDAIDGKCKVCGEDLYLVQRRGLVEQAESKRAR
ncbi:AmmeMemoRadiSam system radical SAM enzyme [Methanomassiliicoccus luminyensis]|uniref:AmmeMemoRadiSam system radical SAM enzyme n=1 Tax=Methanomassiliicoccus luminyensis TaxID=1080712 RepID=UPI00036C5DB0|nr:AmmeMemoRadiSam system radical SAM enzyme [Methanomassiliicoccus luminyensis]